MLKDDDTRLNCKCGVYEEIPKSRSLTQGQNNKHMLHVVLILKWCMCFVFEVYFLILVKVMLPLYKSCIGESKQMNQNDNFTLYNFKA